MKTVVLGDAAPRSQVPAELDKGSFPCWQASPDIPGAPQLGQSGGPNDWRGHCADPATVNPSLSLL